MYRQLAAAGCSTEDSGSGQCDSPLVCPPFGAGVGRKFNEVYKKEREKKEGERESTKWSATKPVVEREDSACRYDIQGVLRCAAQQKDAEHPHVATVTPQGTWRPSRRSADDSWETRTRDPEHDEHHPHRRTRTRDTGGQS